MLQENIHNILYSSEEKSEKIERLRALFSLQDGVIFSDLDDTITTQSSMLYGRLYILNTFLFGTFTMRDLSQMLKRYIVINHRFLTFMKSKKQKKIILLSRNNLTFLENITSELNEKLSPFWLTIIGVVGRIKEWWNEFYFTTEDKIDILPPEAMLISDMFEEHRLSRYPLFSSIDGRYRWYTRLYCTIRKYIRILPFFLGICILQKKFFHI